MLQNIHRVELPGGYTGNRFQPMSQNSFEGVELPVQVENRRCSHSFGQFTEGGSKHGECTFGILYEDCYAWDIPRFICNICLPELTKFHNILLQAAWLNELGVGLEIIGSSKVWIRDDQETIKYFQQLFLSQFYARPSGLQ